MTMLMFVLACCLFAAAQSNMSGDTMKKDNMKDNKMMSMTGCIADKDGKYMMMNKAHPDGVQLMSSDDLKPHVGHKVRVSGMMEKMDNMSADDKMKHDDMAKDDKMKDDKMKDDKMMKHDEMGMKVSSMKMMSEQCDMSKMMNK